MNKNLDLLNEIYTNSAVDSSTLNYILTKTENAFIRKEIINEINEYDKINTEAKNEIYNISNKTPNIIFKKISSKIDAKINITINSSIENVIKTIINKANKNIIDLTKTVNKSQFLNPKYYALARKFLKIKKMNVEKLSQFL
jgi:hypothetical protein